MASEEAPKDSSVPDAEVFQLEALSLNYLRSQNISAITAFTVLCCGHLLHRICLETYIMQGGVRRPSCPICNWDIEINREELGLASGECFLAPKSYDKGQASQQSNVTIEDDEGNLELMQKMGLIEEDSVPVDNEKGTTNLVQVNLTDQDNANEITDSTTSLLKRPNPLASDNLQSTKK
ncbi:1444_t:CDS:2, partial [Acaulospora morrowiae]